MCGCVRANRRVCGASVVAMYLAVYYWGNNFCLVIYAIFLLISIKKHFATETIPKLKSF